MAPRPRSNLLTMSYEVLQHPLSFYTHIHRHTHRHTHKHTHTPFFLHLSLLRSSCSSTLSTLATFLFLRVHSCPRSFHLLSHVWGLLYVWGFLWPSSSQGCFLLVNQVPSQTTPLWSFFWLLTLLSFVYFTLSMSILNYLPSVSEWRKTGE